jgi:hypothetical protein
MLWRDPLQQRIQGCGRLRALRLWPTAGAPAVADGERSGYGRLRALRSGTGKEVRDQPRGECRYRLVSHR